MQASPREERKRRYSEMEETYYGPEEFMEAGVRGFLVTTQADKEEFALDDALELLRQASVMIYGGYTTRIKKPLQSKGYVRINFMDPDDVQILERPEGEPETEEEEEEETEEAKKENAEENAEGQEDNKEEQEDAKEDSEDVKQEGEGEKEEAEEMDDDQDGEGKAEDKKSKNKKERKPVVFMKCQHKFKAFRTELRNTLFIKSNVPDPLELASAAMDLVLKRKTINGEAVLQLLPVQGVCNYDFYQLEIMTQRVLRGTFDENLPAKSYDVLLFDKIAEPGSEEIAETVRNAIWCMNPNSYMSSALTEPDFVIRVELIGSKIVLCCMTSFMMYRQFSPSLLVSLGPGSPEDDDGTDMNAEMKKDHDDYLERRRRAEERKKKEEEERRRYNAEKRARDEERRIQKLEEKKKREEERQKREEETKKKREEARKKREEERKKKKEAEEQAKAAEEEKQAEGEGEEDAGGEGEDETAAADQDADDSQTLDSSQNQSLDESMDAEQDSEPKAKRGRRGRGRGKAKK